MKQVNVTITGDILAVDYCSHKYYESEPKPDGSVSDGSEHFFDEFYLTCGWDTVTGMYINAPSSYEIDGLENVVKQKGKYAKKNDYFHELFANDSDHPLPVDLHIRTYYEQNITYTIELEDDEEFDIKKVQLVKSQYEAELFPYFIIADYILYDGKEVNTWEAGEYCPEEKMYSEYTIQKLYET